MGSLSWDRVTVIIIRCSRQLMQEIGWGFLGKPDRREKQEILDPCRGHYMIYRDLKAKSLFRTKFMGVVMIMVMTGASHSDMESHSTKTYIRPI